MSTATPTQASVDLEHRRKQLHGAFGNDAFGQIAEGAARFFGTPQYIVGQTIAVLAWVVINSTQLHFGFAWDVYPFIALNLLFSLQAAYAAPLILLAQTRQADRDKLHSERSRRTTPDSSTQPKPRPTNCSNSSSPTPTSPPRTNS